ncbi:MAG: tRNA dihydrouridine synthase DusB [Erysipelotrichaceae bacterium]|nr:tRNA dihydrouridine synthase DusB [Erysipelotrichaceae bacterium]
MWKIGNTEIKGKVLLAPMAGYTSFGYRKFMEKFGVDVTVTEMVSDMGLLYGNRETTEYLSFSKSDVPVGVQIFGFEPKNLAKAAEIVIKKVPFISFIDVNMGCPVPKVTRNGAGSALLKNPKLCGEIIREIRKVTDLPVTAKIRLGWDDKNINFLEVINELENAGVAMIGIHARTTKQLYYGEPRYDLLKDIRKKMNVPLVISGNIFTLDDAKNAIDITGADAVMVARGGVGNPTLIKQINQYYEDGSIIPDATFDEQVEYCLELARLLIEEKGEEKAMRVYRSMAPKFFKGIPEVKKLNSRLASELVSYDSLVEIINDYKSRHYDDF